MPTPFLTPNSLLLKEAEPYIYRTVADKESVNEGRDITSVTAFKFCIYASSIKVNGAGMANLT